MKPVAAEPEKAEQHKNATPVQKTVENGNQGLSADEIMQKKREEFFSKRLVTSAVKTRFSMKSEILTLPHVYLFRWCFDFFILASGFQ